MTAAPGPPGVDPPRRGRAYPRGLLVLGRHRQVRRWDGAHGRRQPREPVRGASAGTVASLTRQCRRLR